MKFEILLNGNHAEIENGKRKRLKKHRSSEAIY